ncbi:hypothetical protein OAS86_04220 [Gammaproteobacteria bacterium]|nr:hypothetical protein [Gammaproteobacteria bacterium]
MTIIRTVQSTLLVAAFASTHSALAQESNAAQANNPLANFTAFNIHDYAIGELTESDDSANQLWFRYAKPFSVGESDWLFRGSLPINSYPAGEAGDRETGLGDLNLFAAYIIDVGNPAISFGVGPQITAPTASEDALGSEQWSAGLVNVLFNATSPEFQYGYLLSWQASFSGEETRDDVNLGAFQPFAMYQLGEGHYLRSTAIWVNNFENDNYSVPLGLGYGKVFKRGNTVFNTFIEPQVSVADKGPGFAEWQVFLGFNMQFAN